MPVSRQLQRLESRSSTQELIACLIIVAEESEPRRLNGGALNHHFIVAAVELPHLVAAVDLPDLIAAVDLPDLGGRGLEFLLMALAVGPLATLRALPLGRLQIRFPKPGQLRRIIP